MDSPQNSVRLRPLALERFRREARSASALNHPDQAFSWLEKACAEKSDDLEWIKVNRSADALRSDPRNAALLKKMGLPQ